MQIAALVDEHGFARQDVALELEADRVERHAFRRNHVLDAVRRLANAEHERPDAVRIAERHDAVADDHRDDGVAARATLVERLDGVEDLLRLQAVRRVLAELVREHVQQHFRVGVGVEVAVVLLLDEAFQLVGVDEVAVVREADAVRRVDVERLRFREARAAGRRVAHVAEADVARELQHVALQEDVADEAVALANAQPAAVVRHDAGGVLAAVLEHRQRVVERLIDGLMTDDSDQSTHNFRTYT